MDSRQQPSDAPSSSYQGLNGANSVDYSEATLSLAPADGVGAGNEGVDDTTSLGVTANGPASTASETVQEMHLALLYLLSNPDEFSRAVEYAEMAASSGGNIMEWNADFDDAATDVSFQPGGPSSSAAPPPLPYAVFAEDAEVVLPAAHTANQLFGLERESGIELEAAAGVPALSQLFLRWLALMPEGDHLNIIDPPGLTVMRIAGGRYRCTAAHRVVWRWNLELLPLSSGTIPDSDHPDTSPRDSTDGLHMGDLVTLTIVDVFETDVDGRLLSYCPTFDLASIRKTMKTAEQLRKGGSQVKAVAKVVAKSHAAARFHSAAVLATRLSLMAAVQVKDSVVKKIDDEMQKTAATKAGTPIQNSDNDLSNGVSNGEEENNDAQLDQV